MKKKILLTATVLALSLVPGSSVMAATAPLPAPTYACPYVDLNGDGICDNGDAHHYYADANGDGICDSGDYHHTQYGTPTAYRSYNGTYGNAYYGRHHSYSSGHHGGGYHH